MSGDARDFNNIETRAVIKFPPQQGKAPKEVQAILIEKLGEHAPPCATVKNWVAQFKRGDFSTCDAPRMYDVPSIAVFCSEPTVIIIIITIIIFHNWPCAQACTLVH